MQNLMGFATPEQRKQIAELQTVTQKIKYVVHTESNRVEVSLQTDDPKATEVLPQITEGIVDSVTQMLYQLFAMEGERV
jgi:hypothetical protein